MKEEETLDVDIVHAQDFLNKQFKLLQENFDRPKDAVPYFAIVTLAFLKSVCGTVDEAVLDFWNRQLLLTSEDMSGQNGFLEETIN